MADALAELAHRGEYDLDEIDDCLWMVALCGGSVNRAHAQLVERAKDLAEKGKGAPRVPGRATIDRWRRIAHKNRYHEILRLKQQGVDEVHSTRATELAIQMADAEEKALRQTTAGLSGADAVGASQILRNISQSKAINLGEARGYQDRPRLQRREETVDDILGALKALAHGSLVEVVESDATELPVAEAIPEHVEGQGEGSEVLAPIVEAVHDGSDLLDGSVDVAGDVADAGEDAPVVSDDERLALLLADVADGRIDAATVLDAVAAVAPVRGEDQPEAE